MGKPSVFSTFPLGKKNYHSAAYKLDVDEIAAASRSLTSINLLFLCMIVLLIIAGAYELYKQSRRDIR